VRERECVCGVGLLGQHLTDVLFLFVLCFMFVYLCYIYLLLFVFICCALSVIGHLATDSARSQTKSILELNLSSDAPQRLHEASDPLSVIQDSFKKWKPVRVFLETYPLDTSLLKQFQP
jgi:hypothetical protein